MQQKGFAQLGPGFLHDWELLGPPLAHSELVTAGTIGIDHQPGRVGVHIRYDGSFPETGRILALLGADLLALPTNWPTHSECAAEHQIPTRAMENTVYVMAVNRVGVESGSRFIGASSIADPAGKILAKADASSETTLFADLDPEQVRTKRLVRVPDRHEINRLADRRPAFYGPLVEPNER